MTEQEWHPMSTAPTDGTHVLAIVDVWDTSTGRFLNWEAYVVGSDEFGNAYDADGYDVGWMWEDFKFWKPLNLPPEPKEEGK